jgi:SAM-dependent methyltransferase
MRPGPLIRGLFGPYERAITEAYRRLFVDLDDFVDRLQVWVPQPCRILEVGCGEGAMTERLSAAYPAATVTGTDINPKDRPALPWGWCRRHLLAEVGRGRCPGRACLL